MGASTSTQVVRIESKTRPWGENRPLTAPPEGVRELTEAEAKALAKAFPPLRG